MSDESVQEGKVEFQVDNITTPCQTYYKIFGTLESGLSPVVVLHGGPGAGHEYCLPFSKLWSLHGVPVILYDQIGCAASTHLRQTAGDESFWKVDLFVAELENLLKHFRLNRDDGPGFHILGHSWGGIIGTAFAAKRPPGLRRLVLVGASADGELFFKGIWELTKQLSIQSQQAIDEAVQKQDFSSLGYRAATDEFLRTFLCRASPWPPEELAINFKNNADDNTVRRTLSGPSPWVYNGVLRKTSSIPHLPQISAPTLVINGEYDTTQYEPTVPYFNHIPRVRWVTLANASHMPHLDSEELLQKTLKLIIGFLRPEANGQDVKA